MPLRPPQTAFGGMRMGGRGREGMGSGQGVTSAHSSTTKITQHGNRVNQEVSGPADASIRGTVPLRTPSHPIPNTNRFPRHPPHPSYTRLLTPTPTPTPTYSYPFPSLCMVSFIYLCFHCFAPKLTTFSFPPPS